MICCASASGNPTSLGTTTIFGFAAGIGVATGSVGPGRAGGTARLRFGVGDGEIVERSAGSLATDCGIRVGIGVGVGYQGQIPNFSIPAWLDGAAVSAGTLIEIVWAFFPSSRMITFAALPSLELAVDVETGRSS